MEAQGKGSVLRLAPWSWASCETEVTSLRWTASAVPCHLEEVSPRVLDN